MFSTGFAGTFTVIHTGDSGSGSLFWAIEQANLNAGPDTVRFAIPESDPGFDGTAWWIRPKISLPVLSDDGTAILGGSQEEAVGDKNPDEPEIALDGTDMPLIAPGFLPRCAHHGGLHPPIGAKPRLSMAPGLEPRGHQEYFNREGESEKVICTVPAAPRSSVRHGSGRNPSGKVMDIGGSGVNGEPESPFRFDDTVVSLTPLLIFLYKFSFF